MVPSHPEFRRAAGVALGVMVVAGAFASTLVFMHL